MRSRCRTILNKVKSPGMKSNGTLSFGFNNVLNWHKNGNALQPVGGAGLRCAEWPPLPLPALHRVGGEAPSLPARSYTGLQRTCNQIKHTLHSTQNASIFWAPGLYRVTRPRVRPHRWWRCVLCGLGDFLVLLKARRWSFWKGKKESAVILVKSFTVSSWHVMESHRMPPKASRLSFQKGYRRAALSLLIRNSLHIAVTTV